MVKSKAKHQHLTDCPKLINVGVIIVSTSRAKEMEENLPTTDRSLPVFREILSNKMVLDVDASYNIAFEKIIPDDSEQIKKIIDQYTREESAIHVLIFSGGTGITKKDITIETVTPLFEKELPGFGEIFRYLSYRDIGNSTILSRATAGVINNKIIFLIPGSPNAVRTALAEIIHPELPHVISEIYREIRRDKDNNK